MTRVTTCQAHNEEELTLPPSRSRVTSADVAREAGVSRATVSYVLNDTPHHQIPEPTRRRVLEAVERLGYAPSAAARTLRRGRSDLVLFVAPDWPIGHAFGQTIEHLSGELAEHGLILVTHRRPRPPRPLSELWRALTPAAVIGIEAFDAAEEAAMRAAHIPVAMAVLDDTARRPTALLLSQRRVGRLQVEHLAAAGHRHIGYALPDDPRVRTFADLRLEGARLACERLGLHPPVVQTVPVDGAPTTTAIEAWHHPGAGVTGVCAYSDEVAFALLAGARALGLSVPQDLAVVGVDDVPVARFASPPLTTITHNMPVIARYLATSVRRALSGDPPPRPPRTETTTLVVRESA
jgi:DNA-binding LacI/PurR family transcriptional regulator